MGTGNLGIAMRTLPPICTADQSSLWPSVLRPNGLFWM
jgi:hypothetical protein